MESRKRMSLVVHGFLHLAHFFNLELHLAFLLYLFQRGGVEVVCRL
jgi:hypothetical protein